MVETTYARDFRTSQVAQLIYFESLPPSTTELLFDLRDLDHELDESNMQDSHHVQCWTQYKRIWYLPRCAHPSSVFVSAPCKCIDRIVQDCRQYYTLADLSCYSVLLSATSVASYVGSILHASIEVKENAEKGINRNVELVLLATSNAFCGEEKTRPRHSLTSSLFVRDGSPPVAQVASLSRHTSDREIETPEAIPLRTYFLSLHLA